jgi:hypothetical protein
MSDLMTLKGVIAWIVGGGGAATITFFLMDRIPFLVKLEFEWKRYVSLAIAVLIAVIVDVFAILINFLPRPVGVGWLETLFSVGAIAVVAVLGSQAAHGRVATVRAKAKIVADFQAAKSNTCAGNGNCNCGDKACQ